MNKYKELHTAGNRKQDWLATLLDILISAEQPLQFGQLCPLYNDRLRKQYLNELESLGFITIYRHPNGRYLYEYNKQSLENKESF